MTTDLQTFGDAARVWCTYRRRLCELKLVRDTTVSNQTRIAIVLADGLGLNPLPELRKSHVELFIGERLKSCAPVTVRGELNVLRQILNWCEDEGLLTVKPRLPTVRVPNVETSLPSDEAFEFVLRNLRPPHSLAMEFMMLTGLSPHEMERLQVQDGWSKPGAIIPCDRGLLPTSAPIEVGIGQRPDFQVKQPSRRRHVPLSERAQYIWREATVGMSIYSRVFPSTEAITKAIQRLRNSNPEFAPSALPVGVRSITPKLARKWFASKVAGQQPEHVLQRLMGHAPGSRITREHYVRSTDDQCAAAVEALRS